MRLSLPNTMSSPQDLSAAIIEIREYARWFSHDAIKRRVNSTHLTEPPTISTIAQQLLDGWTARQALSQERLDSLVSSLEELKDNAPSLTITLAAPPTSDIKQTLVAWCRQNIASDILVTFSFNATLLGGMVIRYGSRIFDWSFRRQILAARANFPEVLRRV